GTAKAAVVEFEDVVAGLFDEQAVHADLAHFIDDDGELVAVLLLEDVVEERGLPRAEEAGEDGDGDAFLAHGVVGFWLLAAGRWSLNAGHYRTSGAETRNQKPATM